MLAEPQKRRFGWRFGLRTLFAILTIVCVMLALYASYSSGVRRQMEIVSLVTSSIGSVTYRSPFSGYCEEVTTAEGYRDWHETVVAVSISEQFDSPENTERIEAEILPKLAGLPRLEKVTLIEGTPRRMAALSKLKYLKELSLWTSNTITDSDIGQLRDLRHLTHLEIGSSRATDDALQSLSEMSQLEDLRIGGQAFSDDGVRCLQKLAHLRVLEIWSHHGTFGNSSLRELSTLSELEALGIYSDADTTTLDVLAQFPKLERLVLIDASDANLARARSRLSNCQVSRDLGDL